MNGLLYWNAALGQFVTTPPTSTTGGGGKDGCCGGTTTIINAPGLSNISTTTTVNGDGLASILPATMRYTSNALHIDGKSNVVLENNTNLKLEPGQYVNFVHGYPEALKPQSGSVGYQVVWGSSNLDVVGVASAAEPDAARKVKVWDDLEVQGNLLVNGVLFSASNAGTNSDFLRVTNLEAESITAGTIVTDDFTSVGINVQTITPFTTTNTLTIDGDLNVDGKTTSVTSTTTNLVAQGIDTKSITTNQIVPGPDTVPGDTLKVTGGLSVEGILTAGAIVTDDFTSVGMNVQSITPFSTTNTLTIDGNLTVNGTLTSDATIPNVSSSNVTTETITASFLYSPGGILRTPALPVKHSFCAGWMYNDMAVFDNEYFLGIGAGIPGNPSAAQYGYQNVPGQSFMPFALFDNVYGLKPYINSPNLPAPFPPDLLRDYDKNTTFNDQVTQFRLVFYGCLLSTNPGAEGSLSEFSLNQYFGSSAPVRIPRTDFACIERGAGRGYQLIASPWVSLEHMIPNPDDRGAPSLYLRFHRNSVYGNNFTNSVGSSIKYRCGPRFLEFR